MKDKLMKLLLIMVAAFIICMPATAKAERANLMTIDKPVDAFTFAAAKNGVLTELKQGDEGVIEVKVAESGYIFIGATEYCGGKMYSDNELTKVLKYRYCSYNEYRENKVNNGKYTSDGDVVLDYDTFIAVPVNAGTYYIKYNQSSSGHKDNYLVGYFLPVSKAVNVSVAYNDCMSGTVTINRLMDGCSYYAMGAVAMQGIEDVKWTASATDSFKFNSNGAYTVKVELNGDWKNLPFCVDINVNGLTGHNYLYTTQPATKNNNGMIVGTCQVCGDVSNEGVSMIGSVDILKKKYVYNGKEKKPQIIVKDVNGTVISENYYKATYSNNVFAGKGMVTVIFKDKYSGTISKKFSIVPKKTKITSVKPAKKSVNLKWKKVIGGADGYEIQYSGVGKKKTVNVKAKATSKKITKLHAKTLYSVKIRSYKKVAGGKKVYSAWSKSKFVVTK